jgi:hypothetical protein
MLHAGILTDDRPEDVLRDPPTIETPFTQRYLLVLNSDTVQRKNLLLFFARSKCTARGYCILVRIGPILFLKVADIRYFVST